jgi:dihydroorotase
MNISTIKFPQPDDWHVHLREGTMLKTVVSDTARHFRRAIVMPNLETPITTANLASAYRQEIKSAVGDLYDFSPLMTVYLTDHTDAEDLVQGFLDGIVAAAKLYPAGATTHSSRGVTEIRKLDAVFEKMSEVEIPLLIHGEIVDESVDVFDRERVFIDKVLLPLRLRHPELRIVLEHITTREAADFVMAEDVRYTGATITPHHLVFNRNAMFEGGIRPHFYCLPVMKREEHRRKLIEAATSGDPHFFLGTDSAPHSKTDKETDCGCAGIYNAPVALSCYLGVFEQADALDKFADFASRNGPRFYRLPVNREEVVFSKDDSLHKSVPATFSSRVDVQAPRIFSPPWPLMWQEVNRVE